MEWTVEILVAPDYAVVSWLGVHEHIERADGDASRPWTSVVIDVVAAVLRGEYEVEQIKRGGMWFKTRIVDVGNPQGERVISVSGPLWGFLLRPLPARVARHRMSWAVGA
jgi:hypothetical protein